MALLVLETVEKKFVAKIIEIFGPFWEATESLDDFRYDCRALQFRCKIGFRGK